MSGDDWLLGAAACADPKNMTDDQRESLIQQLTDKRNQLYQEHKRDQARLVSERIAALIAQRSGAFVRRMEHEKGLSSLFCARKPSGRHGGGHA